MIVGKIEIVFFPCPLPFALFSLFHPYDDDDNDDDDDDENNKMKI